MSLLYSEQKAEEKKDDNTMTFAIAAAALVIVAVVYTKRDLIFRFYFRNFEIIWFAVYGVLACSALLATWYIVKRTKHLTDRGNLLNEAGEAYSSIFVGTTTDGVSLYVSEKDRNGHVQIVGSTGRGKTKSAMEPWACRDILRRKSIILIDGKGDPGVLKSIKRAAKRSPRRPEVFVFDIGNPATSCATNPLKSGSAQQITDRIFTAFEFKDPYYRSVQYDITGSIVELIKEFESVDDKNPKPASFKRIYELLTDDMALSQAISDSKNEALRQKLTRFLSMPKQGREEKLSGLITQLAPFAVGELAPLVNGRTEERNAFTVSRILLPTEREIHHHYQYVFVVLIPTLKYQQIGHQLGKLILQELGWAVVKEQVGKVIQLPLRRYFWMSFRLSFMKALTTS